MCISCFFVRHYDKMALICTTDSLKRTIMNRQIHINLFDRFQKTTSFTKKRTLFRFLMYKVLCSPILILLVNHSHKLGVNVGLLAHAPQEEGLEVGDLAEEASDRLGTVEIIVTLETAIQFVKLCLHTSLVPPSVRLARSPGEVRDLRGRGGGGNPPMGEHF